MPQVDSLTTHSYVAKSQARYFKVRKTDIDQTECLILLDLAENYHCVVQYEVQGYHWNKQQCTLYPVILYHKNEKNELQWIAICFVSDDSDQSKERKICNYIKDKLPSVRKVEYFSDGCAGQYKNMKNFINLCCHKIDLNIYASWSFYATSYGKSPCDGIGGTVKCKITRASLQ